MRLLGWRLAGAAASWAVTFQQYKAGGSPIGPLGRSWLNSGESPGNVGNPLMGSNFAKLGRNQFVHMNEIVALKGIPAIHRSHACSDISIRPGEPASQLLSGRSVLLLQPREQRRGACFPGIAPGAWDK